MRRTSLVLMLEGGMSFAAGLQRSDKLAIVKTVSDFEGLLIRITDERLTHILEHPEMAGMEHVIEETLLRPERVLTSFSDDAARLYYRFYIGTKVGDKYVCVVVKVASRDAFVLTAYLTDKIKGGFQIWPKSE